MARKKAKSKSNKKVAKKVVRKKAKTVSAGVRIVERNGTRVAKKKQTTLVIPMTDVNLKLDLLLELVGVLHKAIVGKDAVAPTAEETAVAPATKTNTKAETKSMAKTRGNALTKEDVTQALQKLGTESGHPAVKDLLDHYGATRVSDLKVSDYSDLITACLEKVGNQGDASIHSDFL